MPKKATEGQCALCKKTFSKGSIGRHLTACLSAKPPRSAAKTVPAFHLVVQDRYASDYWLHLLVPITAMLDDLDEFLRGIWLECCGHLSAFEIDRQQFSKSCFDESGDDQDMNVRLGDVLKPGMKFQHDYDFGSTTTLVLQVKETCEAAFKKNENVVLLARNIAPGIPCAVCGKPATHVCTECAYDGAGWLCKKCLKKHECGDEMALPVVNSPRVGVCGYTGPL